MNRQTLLQRQTVNFQNVLKKRYHLGISKRLQEARTKTLFLRWKEKNVTTFQSAISYHQIEFDIRCNDICFLWIVLEGNSLMVQFQSQLLVPMRPSSYNLIKYWRNALSLQFHLAVIECMTWFVLIRWRMAQETFSMR